MRNGPEFSSIRFAPDDTIGKWADKEGTTGNSGGAYDPLSDEAQIARMDTDGGPPPRRDFTPRRTQSNAPRLA